MPARGGGVDDADRRGGAPTSLPDRVEARHEVAALVDERRLLEPAVLGGVAAAGLEAAADELTAQVGRDPGDAVERDARVRVHLRDRVEQRLGVGVAHLREQLASSSRSRRSCRRT